jgi:hypothetical protein
MITRDFFTTLTARSRLEAVFLLGPRQVGKSTLLDQLELKSQVFLDDLHLRQRANEDPAFFIESLDLPCLIDEAQYAPALFPEIKRRIDQERRQRLKMGSKTANPQKTQYYLTGSNQTLINKAIRESLAGRCHIFSLQGLSVKEILAYAPDTPLKTIAFRGGLPDLYARNDLSPQQYFNDYILSFVEKDIAREAGITKIKEFHSVLKLLAARSGQFIHFAEIASQSGVDAKTVKIWTEILQYNQIIELVNPIESNLSKRLVKSKKLHFYDTGLCCRLQGHLSEETLWNSPQMGPLFESLVFSEITKTNINYLKEWQLFTWRTKDQDEIDFVVQTQNQFILIESKLGIQSARPLTLDPQAAKVFPKDTPKLVVTAGGDTMSLSRDTTRVSIQNLGEYLLDLERAI